MSGSVDFERLFAHRGGATSAFKKLAAFAAEKISRHSQSTTGGHAAVAQLRAEEVVGHAVLRALKDPTVWNDGEVLYRELRRHIDNYIRGLAKSKKEDRLVREGDLVRANEDDDEEEAANEPADPQAKSPRQEAVIADDVEFCREVLAKVRGLPKTDDLEKRMIDLLIEGWRDRPDMCDLLKIDPETYDLRLKRIARAAQKLATQAAQERKQSHEQRR
jgi:hypothetical protein